MDIRDIPTIDRHEMVGLATTEYDRLLRLLAQLDPDDWERPTACGGWSVRDVVAHLLGAAEGNASPLEGVRQLVRGRRRARAMGGGPLIDGINAVQVDDRAHLEPAELQAALARIAPRAVRGRRRTPPPLRRIRVPGPLDGTIAVGHLVDVVYTRDQWMHRIDVARATGRDLLLTAEHDGRIVADVVRDWALAHGEPVVLELSGPAGGTYTSTTTVGAGDGTVLQLDALEFALAISGRSDAAGLLGVQVVF